MSDRTTSVVTEQSQHTSTVPVPEPTPEVAAESAAQESAQQAAADLARGQEQAEAQEQQLREETAATLKACVKAFRAGEKAYRTGLLDAGRLADQYIRQRLALGDKRKAAVQTLDGALAAYSTDTVDVNRLVGVYHAYRLLAEQTLEQAKGGKDKPARELAAGLEAVPYGHFRDAWRQLVQRADPDSPTEHWTLLPGLEAECQAAFLESAKGGLSRDAVLERCKQLQRQYADRQAAEAKRAAEQAAAESKAKADAVRAANAAEEQAAREARAAAEAAKQAADDSTKATLTQAAEQAKAELLAKQQQALAAQAEREQAEREQARKDREAKEAADKQAAAEEKARKAAEKRAAKKPADKPADKPAPATVDANLLASGKQQDPQTAGRLAAEFVLDSDTPDDVLEHMLRVLKASDKLGNRAKRACDAALLVLTRPVDRGASVSPVTVAAALAPTSSPLNGVVVPAA